MMLTLKVYQPVCLNYVVELYKPPIKNFLMLTVAHRKECMFEWHKWFNEGHVKDDAVPQDDLPLQELKI